VRVQTPLLAQPLSGPLQLVQVPGSLAIDLTASLSGPVSLTTGGRIEASGVSSVAHIEGLPDIPITRYELELDGGSGGILAAARDLCSEPAPTVGASFTDHNGNTVSSRPALQVEGCTPSRARASVSIAARSVKVTRAGAAPVRVSCGAAADCAGKLTFSSPADSSATRGGTALGSASLRITAGKTRVVRVRMSAAAKRLLLRRKRLRVVATAVLANGAPTSARLTLRTPSRRRART
jgi:hypothetical protein